MLFFPFISKKEQKNSVFPFFSSFLWKLFKLKTEIFNNNIPITHCGWRKTLHNDFKLSWQNLLSFYTICDTVVPLSKYILINTKINYYQAINALILN